MDSSAIEEVSKVDDACSWEAADEAVSSPSPAPPFPPAVSETDGSASVDDGAGSEVDSALTVDEPDGAASEEDDDCSSSLEEASVEDDSTSFELDGASDEDESSVDEDSASDDDDDDDELESSLCPSQELSKAFLAVSASSFGQMLSKQDLTSSPSLEQIHDKSFKPEH